MRVLEISLTEELCILGTDCLILRFGDTVQSARSDMLLTATDFFLQGCLKTKLFENYPYTFKKLEELNHRRIKKKVMGIFCIK
jgi:hypothetical protein